MPENQIILVEDNEDDAELALRALRKNGVEVDVKRFADGPEALEYLLGLGESADGDGDPMPLLVLLDLKLPRLNGIEILERLRAEGPTQLLPVVVLTTSNAENDIVESYQCGANSYIQKPVDFKQFTAAIGEIARYWLGLNQSAPASEGQS